jgi:hypothetical protein
MAVKVQHRCFIPTGVLYGTPPMDDREDAARDELQRADIEMYSVSVERAPPC